MADLQRFMKVLEQVSKRYAELFSICRDEIWFLLKLQEELGELTQAFLMYHGKARTKGKSREEIEHNLRMEIADVIAHALLLAHAHGVDVEQALNEKWFVYALDPVATDTPRRDVVSLQSLPVGKEEKDG